jgi:hypothetical protein
MQLEEVFGKDLLSEIYGFCKPKSLTFDEMIEMFINHNKLQTKIKIVLPSFNSLVHNKKDRNIFECPEGILNKNNMQYIISEGLNKKIMLACISDDWSKIINNKIIVIFGPENESYVFDAYAESKYTSYVMAVYFEIESIFKKQRSFPISIKIWYNCLIREYGMEIFSISDFSKSLLAHIYRDDKHIEYYDIGC